MPFPTSCEQLGASGESPDAVTKSVAELNATIAKATKIRQDDHLNVILPVEDEKLILSGCGDDDSLELFLEQLPSPTFDAASHRDVKRGVAHTLIGIIGVRRQECRFHHNKVLDNGDGHCPMQGGACDEGARSSGEIKALDKESIGIQNTN